MYCGETYSDGLVCRPLAEQDLVAGLRRECTVSCKTALPNLVAVRKRFDLAEMAAYVIAEWGQVVAAAPYIFGNVHSDGPDDQPDRFRL